MLHESLVVEFMSSRQRRGGQFNIHGTIASAPLFTYLYRQQRYDMMMGAGVASTTFIIMLSLITHSMPPKLGFFAPGILN